MIVSDLDRLSLDLFQSLNKLKRANQWKTWKNLSETVKCLIEANDMTVFLHVTTFAHFISVATAV